MAGRKRKAPSPPPASEDTPTAALLSKLSPLPGDELATENGQRYVYTADFRGSRWGRAVYSYGHGELVELPDVPYTVVRSPNRERQEQKEAVADPLMETRTK